MEFALASSHSFANTECKSIQIQIHKNTNTHKYIKKHKQIQIQILVLQNTRVQKHTRHSCFKILIMTRLVLLFARSSDMQIQIQCFVFLSCTHLYTKYICLPTTTTTTPFQLLFSSPEASFGDPASVASTYLHLYTGLQTCVR